MGPPENAGGTRRLAAFLIDYCVVAAYIASLVCVGLVVATLRGATPAVPGPGAFPRLCAQAVGFLTLTLPVISYVALMESSGRGATLGKRALRLRVVGKEGRRISIARGFLRSALKFTPWELAHTALWQVPGRPFLDPPGVANWAGLVAAQILALVWVVSLFLGDRRPLYDRVAGTRVVETPMIATASNGQTEAAVM